MIRTAALVVAAAAIPTVAAAFDCGDILSRLEKNERPISDVRDRCPAKTIEVETDEGWTTITEGDEFCFIEGDNIWQWRCLSQQVSEQCRTQPGFQSELQVKVRFENGDVSWICMGN